MAGEKRLKRNPRKPGVGLQFNEVLSMDLKELEGHLFLVMVGRATHYCQSGWLGNKNLIEIIWLLSEEWVSYFGAPKIIFTDNGGKFQNEEMGVFTEIFDIEMKTTPSESLYK